MPRKKPEAAPAASETKTAAAAPKPKAEPKPAAKAEAPKAEAPKATPKAEAAQPEAAAADAPEYKKTRRGGANNKKKTGTGAVAALVGMDSKLSDAQKQSLQAIDNEIRKGNAGMNKADELLREAVKEHPYKKKSGLFTKEDAMLHIQNLAKEGTAEAEKMIAEVKGQLAAMIEAENSAMFHKELGSRREKVEVLKKEATKMAAKSRDDGESDNRPRPADVARQQLQRKARSLARVLKIPEGEVDLDNLRSADVELDTQVITSLGVFKRNVEEKYSVAVDKDPRKAANTLTVIAQSAKSLEEGMQYLRGLDFSGRQQISYESDGNVIATYIGVAFSRAMELQNEFGVFISRVTDGIEILGTADKVEACKKKAEKLFKEQPAKGEKGGGKGGPPPVIIEIPLSLGRALKGAAKQAVEDASKSAVRVSTPPDAELAKVFITGGDAKAATDAVNKFVASRKAEVIPCSDAVRSELIPAKGAGKGSGSVPQGIVRAFYTFRQSENVHWERVDGGLMIVGPAAEVAEAKRLITVAGETPDRIEIEAHQSRLIQQADLDTIGKETNSIIMKCNFGARATGNPYIEIAGEPKAMVAANKAIEAFVEKNCYSTELSAYPDQAARELKQEKGRLIQSVEQDYSVSVNIQTDWNEGTNSVRVAGPRAMVDQAVAALEKIAAQYADYTTQEVPLNDSSEVSYIVGARGANVRNIQSQSGASINVTETKVVITGDATAVAKAVGLVEASLEECRADPAAAAAAQKEYAASQAAKQKKQVFNEPLENDESFPALGAISTGASKKAGGWGKGKKAEAAAPVVPAEIPSKEFDAKKEKVVKKVVKAGGKRGVEIEGGADMGGLKFFSTNLEEPNGDEWLLLEALKAMNVKCGPDEEERKGCSGHIGKSVYSVHAENTCMSYIIYVPEELQSSIDIRKWFDEVNAKVMGEEVAAASTMILGKVHNDPDAGKFILKLKDEFQAASLGYLRETGNFPQAGDDDDDDEMVFGDDFDVEGLE
eukprot:CAMPEP_0204277828 /NCGR_PEP_ID=MMETSP0468-20130131/29525_1 /ASSEMBLY_ACC=CAM_ASM_000383 /TAXON_ID=2969 /ORGANISM="Oxyrrhis marina" /LENGTH=1001 /DNA_ID=CAMNT_0051254667 /DNA_START=54 /DNA_END=3059 /DNA_ORIENTATION=+